MTIREFLKESGLTFTCKDEQRIGNNVAMEAKRLNIKSKKIPQDDYSVNDYPKKIIPIIGEIAIKYFTNG